MHCTYRLSEGTISIERQAEAGLDRAQLRRKLGFVVLGELFHDISAFNSAAEFAVKTHQMLCLADQKAGFICLTHDLKSDLLW